MTRLDLVHLCCYGAAASNETGHCYNSATVVEIQLNPTRRYSLCKQHYKERKTHPYIARFEGILRPHKNPARDDVVYLMLMNLHNYADRLEALLNGVA